MGVGGGGGIVMHPPPHPHCRAAILAEGAQELPLKQWTTNKGQSKVDEGWLLTRGLNFMPLPTHPKKYTICCWDWEEGVAEFDLAVVSRLVMYPTKVLMCRTIRLLARLTKVRC